MGPELTRVRFLKSARVGFGTYVEGEEGGFSKRDAAFLISTGVAVQFSLPSPPATPPAKVDGPSEDATPVETQPTTDDVTAEPGLDVTILKPAPQHRRR